MWVCLFCLFYHFHFFCAAVSFWWKLCHKYKWCRFEWKRLVTIIWLIGWCMHILFPVYDFFFVFAILLLAELSYHWAAFSQTYAILRECKHIFQPIVCCLSLIERVNWVSSGCIYIIQLRRAFPVFYQMWKI